MNWEDLRFFLAIVKAGTLSGAAKKLKVDQATVSRRLASLEADLGVKLVSRLPRESRLTPAGKEILNEVIEIEEKALSVMRLSSSLNKNKQARVAITAPPILARHFLIPAVYELSQRNPGIQLSIQSEPQFVSLSKFEADLSLRLSPAIEQTDIVRKVGEIKFSLYAAPHYEFINNPSLWKFIGYSHKEPDFAHKRWLYETIGNRSVSCEVTDLGNQYEAACTGIGVAGLPNFLGDHDHRLVKLTSNAPLLILNIWLAKHPDRRNDIYISKIANSIIDLLNSAGLGNIDNQ